MTNWITKQGKLYSRCERCKGTGKYKEWGRYNPCPMYCKDGLIEIEIKKPNCYSDKSSIRGKDCFKCNTFREQIYLKAELIKALEEIETEPSPDRIEDSEYTINSLTFKQDKIQKI